ncbi:unnamed protein product [Meganyctiphanes norvegica]|uniref:Uncharacterized protein n=1 Tax=Meganyctiphanes norvegica TaxID=48144 RepID=A0AAV2S4A2_MEGNR
MIILRKMEDISANSRDDSESEDEDDDDLWNLFESEAITANSPDADDGSKSTGEDDGDCSKSTDEDDDIWNLFENIYPDESDSVDVSDTKCNTHESEGKNIINSNSSVSPISISSSPHAEENAHYINKVTYSSHENENKNNCNSKQYSDSSSPHAEESTQDIDEVTCNSFENDAKNSMNNKRISTINQYVEEGTPNVESDSKTDDSDSVDISDTKCNTPENEGKNVINSNSSVSPISISSSPHAEENTHYIDKVTYSSHENENKNNCNSKQYSDSSSPHAEESTQDIDEVTCNSFENYAKNSMNNKQISTTINQYVEESIPNVESDSNTLDRENKNTLGVRNDELHESFNKIKEEDCGSDVLETSFLYEEEDIKKEIDKEVPMSNEENEDSILETAISKGHIKEEDDKYFCNLCSTTSFNTKSLFEHIKGKKHEKHLLLSSKGIFNQSYENYYYEMINEEVLSSSAEDTNENSFLSSIDDQELKRKHDDSDENKPNKVHITEDMLSSCDDSIVLEAVNLGYIELDTLGEITCTVCNVSSTKWSTLRIHLKGKKHQLRVKEVSESLENGDSSCDTNYSDILTGHFINMSGLPTTANENDIIDFFNPVDIVSIRFIVNSTEEDLSSHLGEADVEFLSQDDAAIAMTKHMSHMNGNIIHLAPISTSLVNKDVPNASQSHYPASLRLVVTDSKDVSISTGTVIVLTSEDTTILLEARDIKKLKDIDINYNETVFYIRDMEEGHFQFSVQDLGSKGGTLVNGTLISARGTQSELVTVNHGDTVECGLVMLLCHIHTNSLYCFDCEQGTKITTGTSSKLKLSTAGTSSKLKNSKESTKIIMKSLEDTRMEDKEVNRRKEHKLIRKKYGLQFMFDMVEVPSNPKYKDRANKRRKEHGSDNPFEKTEVAHTSVAITKKNKGFKMLSAMGWKEGESLGKDNTGRLEPIAGDEVKNDRTGLGSTVMGPPIQQRRVRLKRDHILNITKKRFYKDQ